MNKVLTNQRGAAILIALALIAMLTSVAIMSVDRSTTDIELAYNQLQEDRAFYVAEAGLQRAIAELKNDDSWRQGFYRQVLDGGYYSASVTDSTIDPSLGDTLIIKSLGYFTRAVANVEMWVTPKKLNPFQFALFGDAGVLLENNSCTDSYNSDSGSYAATQANDGGTVGSNGTVELQNNSLVGGDAVSAKDSGGVIIGMGASVTGDTTSNVDSLSMSIVPDSEYVWANANNSAPTGLSGAGYSYNPGLDALFVGAGGNLTLASGVYYFSSIKIESDGRIDLALEAQVTIYVTGDILLENNAKINSGGSPRDFLIFSKGSQLKLENDSEFYGAFYGPNANFIIENNSNLYGSIVANSIKLENNACFHYDRKLGSYSKGTTGEINVIAWRLQ